MKAFEGYDETKTIGQGGAALPVGAYPVQIKGAEVVTRESKNGSYDQLLIHFDICEGDRKDYFLQKYQADTSDDKKWKGTLRLTVPSNDGSEMDEWNKRRFKTAICAIEDSKPNKGYTWDWDEKKLKDKYFCAIMGEHETYIEGNSDTTVFVECRHQISIDDFRADNYKIPERYVDKRAKEYLQNNASADTGFLTADTSAEEIPF